MPNSKAIFDELVQQKSPYDAVRQKYIKRLHKQTGRNVIIYYSGWLQKAEHFDGGGEWSSGFEVNDADQNGFMATIHKCVKEKGLDLILHTPGGQVAATESLVNYLRSIFGHDIRAIIPQIAMSAGTMIACGCKEIVMGKHSSIGPIDPQFGGLAAQAVLDEYSRARTEISLNPNLALFWQPILAKYPPTFEVECQQSVDWANAMVTDFLKTGMFEHDPDKDKRAQDITDKLSSHADTKTHSRHISLKAAKELGLTVVALEDDAALQDTVLSIHHACIATFSHTEAIKIIENHFGVTVATRAATLS
jgi:ClpP class serine protease